MQSLITLGSAWGVITLAFVVLVLYRRSLTNKETDWIPLNEYGKEAGAIQAQTVIEMKTRKLTLPIRALGTLSIIILLVIVGLYIYHNLSTPPGLYQQ